MKEPILNMSYDNSHPG
jgi:hypothetical protein